MPQGPPSPAVFITVMSVFKAADNNFWATIGVLNTPPCATILSVSTCSSSNIRIPILIAPKAVNKCIRIKLPIVKLESGCLTSNGLPSGMAVIFSPE